MDLLIRNIRPMGAAPADLLVRGGLIAEIAPSIEAAVRSAIGRAR